MNNKLWGGRFSDGEMDPEVMKFTSSLDVDKRLAKYDCLASKVHVEMLAKCGYISNAEKKDLLTALDEVSQKTEKGNLSFEGYEDIHSLVQDYVAEKCPDAAKKMHTARSRNEQVVNDVRLYVKDAIACVKNGITALQKALAKKASENKDVIIPGYTHLNRAQPILFAHLLLGYIEMLERDISRFQDAEKRADVLVMGSGAVAGSSLKLDRKFVADKLGFKTISANSIDAVSDRDFIIEFLSAVAITSIHLSRICEDLILYTTPEFGFIAIGDKYCTGSSLMPQKKNPDVLELVRGKSANAAGALNSVIVLMKGLPHAYNRDMQEDKKPLFEAADGICSSLKMMGGVIGTITLNKEKASKPLEDEFIYATDLAEHLIKKGMSFSLAHRIVGNIVKDCSQDGKNISDLSLAELKSYSDLLDGEIYGLLNAETSVSNKSTAGSTNPGLVAKELDHWIKKLR